MLKIFPRAAEPFVFAFFLTAIMSFLISGVATFTAGGLEALRAQWAQAWLTSWPIAYPAVLIVRPVAVKLTRALLRPS
jgi:hypothetical protein